MGVVIRKAVPEDFPSIVKLINQVFGISRTQNWFNHIHLDNPAGKSIMFVGEEENGDIVSYRSIVLSTVQYHNQKYICGQLADACTHPIYRGQGIYSKINYLAIQEFFSYGDVIIAFPGPMNYPILKKKFGFVDVTAFRQGICPLELGSNFSTLPKQLCKVFCSTHHFLLCRPKNDSKFFPATDFIENVSFVNREDKFSFSRNLDKLSWRLSMPGKKYTFVHIGKNDFMILGTERRHGLNLCTIVDGRYSSRENLSKLIGSSQKWAKENGYQALYTWIKERPLYLVSKGFIPLPKKTNFIVKYREGFPYAKELCTKQLWDINLLDTDAY